jgi:YidC/Oxa1 family membrane protein insertase
MDSNNRNFLLAVVLSIGVLFLWEFFYAIPQQQERALREQAQEQTAREIGSPQVPTETPLPGEAGAPPRPGLAPTPPPREAALQESPRIQIKTPSLSGSLSLRGARIDDLVLTKYRMAVEPDSPHVTLLSPAGTPHAYYAEYGWVAAGGADLGLPTPETEWEAETSGPLTPESPAVLTYDNGNGLLFRRTISVDEDYMFRIEEEVQNQGAEAVTLYPYGLITRHERPQTEGFFILHEGLIGVLGEAGLEELSYSKVADNPPFTFRTDSGWLGITDKYWAAVVIPEQGQTFDARFSGARQGTERFQTDYLSSPVSVPAGGAAATTGLLFAGAKEVQIVDAYAEAYSIPKFDLLIDWGWFYFLTKPLFFALDYFYKLVGNFGVAILIVTVIIKLILFPLANKSYVAMSKMKKLAPEMQRIKERYPEDRMRQQQAMMELYKKEKVNPASGCLPILVQIPIFFALYKVLFVTIEMRHAPFFGWIRDLSAPDPTSIFNLFGLIPWQPPELMLIGIWPIIMGITMWFQMKLNPQPPDPIQQKIFTWMPLFFTILLARFPAGLVIYWAWNNFLSILQQAAIMKRQGVEIPLLENLGVKSNKKNAKGETEG